MALNKDNIVYSLLASTILANLDRPILEKLGDLIILCHKRIFRFFSSNIKEEKISLDKNIKPLHLPSEISNIELIEAEQKTEERKEIVLENQPPSTKKSNVIGKIMNRVWYTRPVSDEGDLPDENQNEKITDDHAEKKIGAPDIDTSHSTNIENETNNDEDSKIIEQEKSVLIPSWINDQVYGDKVSVV